MMTLKTAEQLGYASRTALKQACRAGRIKASKLGRDWVVTHQALLDAGYKPKEMVASQNNETSAQLTDAPRTELENTATTEKTPTETLPVG